MPDPAALVLRSDKGTILHTGDWKFDKTPVLGEDTDRERLRQIGDEGVMALIGDSTNAMVDGHTLSEVVAMQGLTDVIAEAEGLVAVTCFASNVARLESIIAAAVANCRSVCVVGRAMDRVIRFHYCLCPPRPRPWRRHQRWEQCRKLRPACSQRRAPKLCPTRSRGGGQKTS